MPQISRDQIFTELSPIFAQVFGDPGISLGEQTTAHDIERWDSLNHITMIVAVEQKFGIKFKTAEVTRFPNVGAMVTSIQDKLARMN